MNEDKKKNDVVCTEITLGNTDMHKGVLKYLFKSLTELSTQVVMRYKVFFYINSQIKALHLSDRINLLTYKSQYSPQLRVGCVLVGVGVGYTKCHQSSVWHIGVRVKKRVLSLKNIILYPHIYWNVFNKLNIQLLCL